MIPAEAVEAAARAAAKDEDASNWVDENEYYRNGWRNRMQVGLEAAHPVLLAELRKAHEALTRVEEVHQPRQFNPISDGVYFGQSEFNHNICAYDHEHWPCPTAAAVAAANGEGRG